jgi:hypothetical protein
VDLTGRARIARPAVLLVLEARSSCFLARQRNDDRYEASIFTGVPPDVQGTAAGIGVVKMLHVLEGFADEQVFAQALVVTADQTIPLSKLREIRRSS